MPFVPNPAEIERLLHSPRGPVIRSLVRKAVRVESGAKRRCPVDTGRLRSSIHWTLGRDSKGFFAKVGTPVEYAAFVHEGHGSYSVGSTRGPGTALHFTVGGDDVFISWPNEVEIPAVKGIPFLKDALHDIEGM